MVYYNELVVSSTRPVWINHAHDVVLARPALSSHLCKWLQPSCPNLLGCSTHPACDRMLLWISQDVVVDVEHIIILFIIFRRNYEWWQITKMEWEVFPSRMTPFTTTKSKSHVKNRNVTYLIKVVLSKFLIPTSLILPRRMFYFECLFTCCSC